MVKESIEKLKIPLLNDMRSLKSESNNKEEVVKLGKDLILGKRGRFYLDVWDEEDFVMNMKQETPIQVIDDWSSLFHSYSEYHDGYYREYMNFLTPNYKKICKVTKKDNQSSTMKIIEPPVPVALQHPASWGIGNRIDPKKLIDSNQFQKYHPAAYSTTIVLSPCVQANIIPKFENEYDIDELTIKWKDTINELQELEIKNYERLIRLEKYSEISIQLESIRAKHCKLQQVLCTSYQANQYKTSDRYTYAVKPKVKYNVNKEGDVIPTQNCIRHEMKLKPSSKPTRANASTMTMPIQRSNRKRELIGSLVSEHVEFGNFINTLESGDLVEVFKNDNWTIGKIKSKRFDDDLLLRFLKISLLDCSPEESLWIAVEDSLVAPIGTNTAIPLKILSKYASTSFLDKIETKLLRNRKTKTIVDSNISNDNTLPACQLQLTSTEQLIANSNESSNKDNMLIRETNGLYTTTAFLQNNYNYEKMNTLNTLNGLMDLQSLNTLNRSNISNGITSMSSSYIPSEYGVNGMNAINGVDAINGVNAINGANGINQVHGTNTINHVYGINGANGITSVNGINQVHGVNGANRINQVHGVNGINHVHGVNGVNDMRSTTLPGPYSFYQKQSYPRPQFLPLTYAASAYLQVDESRSKMLALQKNIFQFSSAYPQKSSLYHHLNGLETIEKNNTKLKLPPSNVLPEYFNGNHRLNYPIEGNLTTPLLEYNSTLKASKTSDPSLPMTYRINSNGMIKSTIPSTSNE